MCTTATIRAAALAAAALAAGGLRAAQPGEPPADAGALPGPLLREGSFVLQVRGSLHRDEAGWWEFRVENDDPEAPGYELTLLPCTLLANLETLVEASPDRIVFDLTGQVFVYRNRNYLLPTHAPRLVDYVAPPPTDEPGDDDADSAEAILRNLEREVGPVPRSPRAGAGAGTSSLLPPGAVLAWRRGHVTREDDGTVVLVFAADASGLADPPMVLMPCLLLQDIERFAQRAGRDAAVLLSGRVYRYQGRNYLLPTAFQVPRHRTPLRP